jgi:very-short-patch-repair endonuclease
MRLLNARFRSTTAPAHTQAVIELMLAAANGRHGLLTLEEVRATGRSRSAWHRAHRGGLLVPVHPGVSRVAALDQSPEQEIHAATLASDGMASHLSAAWLWGADVEGTAPVDVTVTDRRRSARLARVRVHRPSDLADLRPVERDGIQTTNPLRTALDVGAVCEPERVAAIVEHLVVQRLLSLPTLRAAVPRHSRRGRRGLGALRLVLDDWAIGDKPPDSVLEPAMARLLREHSLAPAVFHHVVVCGSRRFELDFGLLDARIGVEVDGWPDHASREAFEADRERDAYLAGIGWSVLRFTWQQVRLRPEWVAERIRAAVAARRPQLTREADWRGA